MSSSRASVLASLANLRHRSLAKRLAEGLRAPAAVSIGALTESAQNLTPSKNLRNAQLLYDELIARRASMVACMLRLPEEIREQADVAALTEAQHSRLLRMLRSQRPRSHEEVERFDAELRAWRDDGDDQDGESRRAIGAALGEVARDADQQHGDPSEWQKRLDAQLDGVFAAHIGIAFLTNHYLAAKAPQRDGWSGSVQLACSPWERCARMARLVEERCAACPVLYAACPVSYPDGRASRGAGSAPRDGR